MERQLIKNNLQYAGIVFELFIIYFLIARFRSKEVFNFMLIVASVYLMLADSIFTTYKGVYDINNFIGPVSISRLLFSAKRGRVEIGFKHMV